MCENVNINVSETNETINIVATEVQEVIDINVFETAEDVTLNITEQLIQVNVNKVTAAEQIQSDWAQTDNEALDFIKNKPTIPTNTSDLINDGEDGVNPFITANDIPPVTGFVPYTGATEDVNLGEFGLLTGNVEFDNTPTNIPTTAGAMYWNDADGTADLILKGGNVKLQIGQESVIRVVNKTATNINLLEANYQAVRVTGAQGQRLKVDLAQATNDNLSAETIGLVTETINNNQEGFITTSGLVRNINTTGSLQGETWADGDILYLSPTTAGNVTKVKPTAPNHLVIIGYVVHAHANQGSIFVKVDNGYELDELHNVKITSAANNNVLAYTSATDIWENKTVETALGYTPENVANKSTSTSLGTSDTLYPTQNAVKVYADTKFTLPSLTSGSVLFSNGTTIAQDNANLFWDDTNNRLGIGTNAPNSTLHLSTSITAASAIARGGNITPTLVAAANSDVLVGLEINPTFTLGAFTSVNSVGLLVRNGRLQVLNGWTGTNPYADVASFGNPVGQNQFISVDSVANSQAGIIFRSQLGNRWTQYREATNSNLIFLNASTGTSALSLFYSSNNVGINTTTDAGFKLDVNGTARVSGQATLGNIIQTSGNANTFTSIINHMGASQSVAGLNTTRICANNDLSVGYSGSADASAVIEARSTTKGFLPPRMTTTQKNAIATPAAGLVVYDTTLGKLCVRGAAAWETITSV